MEEKIINDNHEVTESKSELKGLGGWLVLMGIGIVVSPLVALFGLNSSAKLVGDPFALESLSQFNNLIVPFFKFTVMYSLMLFVYSIVVAIMFFRKKKVFVKLNIIGYIIAVVYAIASVIAFIGMPSSAFGDIIQSLVSAVIGGVIWTMYLLKSVRVKNTFIN